MKSVAIVVQRWHPDLAGGSERHAGLYARYLSEAGVSVDLITTTAKDAVHWRNEYEPGIDTHDGFRVLRFSVAGGRRADWNALHEMLLREAVAIRSEAFAGNFFSDDSEGIAGTHEFPPKIRWPRSLQEEWIRRQGPDSPELTEYLAAKGDQYACVIFLTYLFATTYFGSARLPGKTPALFVPTLHDEAPAYLPAFARRARGFDGILWNSEAEERLGQSIWGPFPDSVRQSRGGMGIAVPAPEPEALQQSSLAKSDLFANGGADESDKSDRSFALYCGRISSAKGCGDMIEGFLESLSSEASGLPRKLVLTGDLQMELPDHPALVYAGFVSEAVKFALMSAAKIFFMPSGFESLSVVTLEAMGQGTPVLGNAESAVIQDHIRRSGAGRLYRDRESFGAGLRELAQLSEEERRVIEAKARSYVVENFSHASVRERVLTAVRAVAR